MKIGVSSYSFSRVVGAVDIIAEAKEMGFDVIEFAGLRVPEGETLETTAERTKERCAEEGIEIAGYTIAADFLKGSGGSLDDEIERVKGEVSIAGILGAPLMRHDATGGFPADHVGPRRFDDALPILSRGCRAVTEFAADMGIRTTVENHGFFCQDSVRVEKLANAVAHPNFGLLVDIGNFLCADEPPAEALGRVMPYAVHVHAKDFHTKSGNGPNPGAGWFRSRGGNYLRGSIIGHGDVPVTQCLRIMKAAGYDGVLSIEFEGMEDPLRAIPVCRDNLRRYLQDDGP